jgi:hypothetical protein
VREHVVPADLDEYDTPRCDAADVTSALQSAGRLPASCSN